MSEQESEWLREGRREGRKQCAKKMDFPGEMEEGGKVKPTCEGSYNIVLTTLEQ